VTAAEVQVFEKIFGAGRDLCAADAKVDRASVEHKFDRRSP
jgi:hypothetical protein